jgi:rhodanese-related sulfurtransferase
VSLFSAAYGAALRCTGRSAWVRAAAGQNPLRDLEADLRRRYPTVAVLEPDDLPSDCLLFDVREAAEFEVGHLRNAIRIAPRATLMELRAAAGPRPLDGANAVFYCAVGIRSARLVARLQGELIRGAGCGRVAHLSGGIFRWHNEARPLVGVAAPVDRVHPFNRHWRKFLLARTAVPMP